MQPNRVQQIRVSDGKAGKSVTYVMSRDQRTMHNQALEYAQNIAIERNQPLAVVFVLSKKGQRAREHYEFMIEGLKELEKTLSMCNIPFMMLFGEPAEVLEWYFGHTKPSAVVFDFSPLDGPRKLIQKISERLGTDVAVVDAHNTVPIWQASEKQEVGARTLRPKIHKQLGSMLSTPFTKLKKHPVSWPGVVIPLSDLTSKIDTVLDTAESNGQKLTFKSGEKAAHAALEDFIDNRLKGYSELRNKPELSHTSDLSPYLHYGQLSSLQVVERVLEEVDKKPQLQVDADVLIEEMVVRKELSDNYCYYTESYRSLKGAPQWAQKTLSKHSSDPREHIYSIEEFRDGKTHDSAWNASQIQLVKSGKMHGYMRMYWAKKVLEWSPSPESALQTLIYLNDFYSIDGGDPNGYTGIMWSVCGVHDRPWGERPIYGVIRSMVYSGLKRKFDIETYERQWGAK